MKIYKAGCYLVNTQLKKIGLVYRDMYDDYTFPKGHLENGETLIECAIRETAEETKRDCMIVSTIEPTIEEYISSKGEDCVSYLFVAIDTGHSDNTSLEVHDLVWVDIDDVEKKLSYDGLKKYWLDVKDIIKQICNGESI